MKWQLLAEMYQAGRSPIVVAFEADDDFVSGPD